MIAVTRRTHEQFWLNEDLLETMEANPDTVLTLVSGEKVCVLESPHDILESIARGGRRRRAGRLATLRPVRPEMETGE